jgi:hypothetical protein
MGAPYQFFECIEVDLELSLLKGLQPERERERELALELELERVGVEGSLARIELN